MRELVLYGRPGCHLCDDARVELERVGHPFTEVDIESDDELFKRYLEAIPVVTLDGVELFRFHVDPDVLTSSLQSGCP